MDSTKLLNSVISTAESIIRSQPRKSSIYESWYRYAESALERTFGEEWRAVVMWEGYFNEPAFAADVERLKRAVGYVRSALSLIGDELQIRSESSAARSIAHQVSTDIAEPANIFIVHGHDDVAKLELKNYLQNTLGLPEPVVLHEKPNYGRAIIEKFEHYATKASFAFVLLTPDDPLAEQGIDTGKRYRARQNVIFEMGYFLGLFGRTAGRVILLYKGELDIPSDITGLVYIDISNGIDAVGEKIRRELSEFLGSSRVS